MKSLVWTVLLAVSCFVSTVSAQVTDLSYTIQNIGGGLFQYDFTWELTNADNTWSPGEGFNWVIFGDVPFPGPSPLADFSLLSETFPNPNMNFSFSGGGHNGPTFLDTVNIVTNGWLPLNVGDTVTWSGTSANYVDTDLRFSALFAIGDVSRPDFQQARFISNVPEPTVGFLLGLTALGAVTGRRSRKPRGQ